MSCRFKFVLKGCELEIEGEQELVKEIYQDFKEKIIEVISSTPQEDIIPPTIDTAVKDKPDEKSPIATIKPDKKRATNKRKESYSIVTHLDLSSKAKEKSLKDFFEEKQPKSGQEKNAVFVFYLAKIAQVTDISEDHIYTCYKNVGVKVPNALRQNLADTAHHKGWIDTASLNNIKITVQGENFVEHDLPKLTGK